MSTTDISTGTRPPAWHPDPSGRHRLRWWDGVDWTDRVVDDGDQILSDPPVRQVPAATQPVVDDAPTAIEAPTTDEADEADGPLDPMAGFAQLGKKRLPLSERPTTGAGIVEGPSRRGLILGIAGAAVVLASIAWGISNHSSASRWQDRGEDLQAELETQSSNLDALERSLGDAASRGAGLADDQETMAELRGATVATVDQLRQCALQLNDLLNVGLQSDPVGYIDRANQTCNAAVVNGETLIAILDALEAS